MSEQGVRTMMRLIAELPEQLRSAWSATAPLALPRLSSCKRVIVCGMGGSAAAAEVCAGSFPASAGEIVVNRGYTVATVLREDDLVIYSSYSGDTEETLACFDDVQRRRPAGPSLAITSGGTLAARAVTTRVHVLELPSGLPPRASLGFGVGRLCGVIGAIGRINPAEAVEAAIARLEAGNLRWGIAGAPATDRTLEEGAELLFGRLPVIYAGAPVTVAVARRLRAQLNENAKILALTAELPELDHNEIVGWSQRTAARDAAVVIALRDPEEHPQVRRRFAITREVLRREVPVWIELEATPGPALARTFELVQAGDVLSVLLAARAGIDPVPVVPIDVLKRQLAEPASET